ncbi:MAG: hypothetical protein KA319_00205 [Ferruginibacter sp.]|nr:hypothetical protein [Ferruginibacter sp.]
MLWYKNKQDNEIVKGNIKYPYRFCKLYISDDYNQIIFVPFGKISSGIYAEIDDLIIDSWPCDFEKLQNNIEKTLNKFAESAIHTKSKWPSYDNSKAKSQKSFEANYICIRLETDAKKEYGEFEVERITASAKPSILDTTYSLVGTNHLLETSIAQMVIDIFEACLKIRNN